MCGLPLEYAQLTRGHTFWENCLYLSSSYQLPTTSQWDGTWSPIPLSMLGLDLPLACTGLVYSVTTTVSSHVQLLCCALKSLIPCSHSPSLSITRLQPTFLQQSSWLWRMEFCCLCSIQNWVLNCLLFSASWPVWVFVLITIYCQQKLQMKVDRCIKLWVWQIAMCWFNSVFL